MERAKSTLRESKRVPDPEQIIGIRCPFKRGTEAKVIPSAAEGRCGGGRRRRERPPGAAGPLSRKLPHPRISHVRNAAESPT